MKNSQFVPDEINRMTQIVVNEYRAYEELPCWYSTVCRTGSEFCHSNGYDMRTFAFVCAALSPNNAWPNNYYDALDMLLHPDTATASTYGENVERARRIRHALPELAFSFFNDPQKTGDFGQCILNPRSGIYVAIDMWALRMLGLTGLQDKSISPSAAQYLKLREVYYRAGDILGVLPHRAQSQTWVTYRARHNEKEKIPSLKNRDMFGLSSMSRPANIERIAA